MYFAMLFFVLFFCFKFSRFFSTSFSFPARIFPVRSLCGAGREGGRGQRLPFRSPFVPRGRVELPLLVKGNRLLKPACLPISPSRRTRQPARRRRYQFRHQSSSYCGKAQNRTEI